MKRLRKLMTISKPSGGPLLVWKRNFRYFKATLLISAFWILLEPLMYLGAIGFGLGAFVNQINGVTYIDFFFPALLCSTSMLIAFFESTYASFTKLTHQNTYSTIVLAPISPEEIIFGEILWGATKGLWSAFGVIVVASFFHLVDFKTIWLTLPILAVNAWAFSAAGMLVTSMAINYDSFIYATSGIIVPMSLFSGTYFPIQSLPAFFQSLTWVFPLTHSVAATRAIHLGQSFSWVIGVHILALIVFGLVCQNLSIQKLSKKIIT